MHRLASPGTTATAPPPPGARFNRLVRNARDTWQGWLRRDHLWVVVFVLVGTWALAPSRPWGLAPQAEAGSIAGRDFVAPHDSLVLDREATATKQRRARDEVLPVYDYDPAAAARTVEELEAFFAVGRAAAEEGSQDLAERLEGAALGVRATPEQLQALRRRDFAPQLLERLVEGAELVLARGVVAGKNAMLESRGRGILLRDLSNGAEKAQLDVYGYLDYPDEVHALLQTQARAWSGYSAAHRTLLVDFLVANLAPNLHLNQSETVKRQEAAADSIEQVYNRVRKGQVIVRQGDQIDPQAAALIGEITGRGRRGSRALPVLATLLLLGAVALLLWLGVRKGRVVAHPRPSILGEALLLLLLALLGGKLGYLLAAGLGNAIGAPPFDSAHVYDFAIPFAALALVAVALYGRALALLLALVYSLLAGVILEDTGWALVLYAMVGSLAAILTVDHYHFRQRSVMLRAGAVVGGAGVACVLMLSALAGGEPRGGELTLEVVSAFAGGLLAAGVASFMVPVLESLFSLTTGIKLVELANTNLPLLRRLAFEAPGTFQHSLMVANLAKAGSEEIGADAVLAYTGALYHDVGKVFRPEYFIENQRPGHNRHDKLLPSMSARILINHVKEGLELGRQHHLPEPLLDAIAEHHGTRLISYFFNKAKERHDPQSGELAEAKFRYPGPRPGSKVMGVLMLADAVEAACRTLDEPTPARLRTVIKTIVADCLRDGQLDETDLTLGDLNRVAEAFQRVLTHLHHRRLDYPGFDFNRRTEREERAAKPESGPVAVPAPAPPAAGGGLAG
ncbi:MAG TPA: HDIG domain-containing protein [Thermoanaerobaculia bacterium]|nr:HDIG domain-containing protein [Thermoanaerobaculia bacterium]